MQLENLKKKIERLATSSHTLSIRQWRLFDASGNFIENDFCAQHSIV